MLTLSLIVLSLAKVSVSVVFSPEGAGGGLSAFPAPPRRICRPRHFRGRLLNEQPGENCSPFRSLRGRSSGARGRALRLQAELCLMMAPPTRPHRSRHGPGCAIVNDVGHAGLASPGRRPGHLAARWLGEVAAPPVGVARIAGRSGCMPSFASVTGQPRLGCRPGLGLMMVLTTRPPSGVPRPGCTTCQ